MGSKQSTDSTSTNNDNENESISKLTGLYMQILETDSDQIKNHLLQFIENEMNAFDTNDREINEEDIKFISRLQSIADLPSTLNTKIKAMSKLERECGILSRIVSYQHSINFQKDLMMVIMDLCHGHNSLNTPSAYIARVLDAETSEKDESNKNELPKYTGYNCDYIGNKILKKAAGGYNAVSLNTTPYPVDRLVIDETLRERLVSHGTMTVSFRFKCKSISTGTHYGSLIQIMSGQSLNGNMLAKMGVIDDNWHVCVVRIEKKRTTGRKLSDVIRGFDLDVRYTVDNIDVNTEKVLVTDDIDSFDLKVCGFNFGGHVSTRLNNVYKRVDGEVEDIRIYEWILDDIQCQTLMDNYHTK